MPVRVFPWSAHIVIVEILYAHCDTAMLDCFGVEWLIDDLFPFAFWVAGFALVVMLFRVSPAVLLSFKIALLSTLST